MSNPKLAFLIPNFYGGGAELVMIRLANELSQRGREVELVAFRPEGEHRDVVDPGLRVIDLGSPSLLTAPFAVRRYLRESHPAILVSALPAANLAAAAAKLLSPGSSTKLVLTEHASLAAWVRHDRGWKRHLLRLVAPRLYRVADHVVGVSKGMADDVRAFTGLAGSEVSAIYNPALSPELEEASRAGVDEPLWPSGDEPVIVTAGRLELQKDYGTLLRAFSSLQERCPSQLVLFGQGSLRAQLERLVVELDLKDRVRFVGFVDNPLPHWRRADLFVLSSLYEGFGMVLVEALACGLRIVSTDCPVGPAEVLGDGAYGELVAPSDPDALARAMARSLAEPVDPERQLARAREFSVANATDAYEALFRELLATQEP